MKLIRLSLVFLILLVNLIVALPSWADTPHLLVSNSEYFQVGQKVIWLYKPRADSAEVQRIPAEIVKLGSKQLQIKVAKHKNQFINRWVNSNRLEHLQ